MPVALFNLIFQSPLLQLSSYVYPYSLQILIPGSPVQAFGLPVNVPPPLYGVPPITPLLLSVSDVALAARQQQPPPPIQLAPLALLELLLLLDDGQQTQSTTVVGISTFLRSNIRRRNF
jgi:hypothetical protein